MSRQASVTALIRAGMVTTGERRAQTRHNLRGRYARHAFGPKQGDQMARQSSPKDDGSDQCRSRRRHGRSETSRGRSTGWIGSSCWFNPSPRTRSRISTATTGPSRSKRVLEGEVFIEVDGQARVCRTGEMGVVPAGAVHGFRGLGAPAPGGLRRAACRHGLSLSGRRRNRSPSARRSVGPAGPGDGHGRAGVASHPAEQALNGHKHVDEESTEQLGEISDEISRCR